jgi:hypothetical protein
MNDGSGGSRFTDSAQEEEIQDRDIVYCLFEDLAEIFAGR